MTLVKICGITNQDDALASVEAGADALGFNFYRNSTRFVEPDQARRIVDGLPKRVLTVGVFVNESPDEVRKIVSRSGVGAIQLHGDETPEYCEQLSDHFVIKALRVTSDFEPLAAIAYKVQAVMLDTYDPVKFGGTGHVMDWSTARKTRDLVTRLFLAGGLSPENVAQAIAEVSPYAVDVCTSLEMAPGKKDHNRVRAFIRIAHDTVVKR
jgi:phosphoribosylanthranilate isomerase